MTYKELLQYKLCHNKTFVELVKRWAGYDITKFDEWHFWFHLDALVNYNDIFGADQNHLSTDFVIEYINYKLFTKICCQLFIQKFHDSPECIVTRTESDGNEHVYSLSIDGPGRSYSELHLSQMITFHFIEETPVKNSQAFDIRAFYEEPIPVSFKNCELLDHVLKFRWALNQEKDVEIRLRDFSKNMFQELIDGVRK